ncbi:helix-turn-helix domain-containing protein [Lacticaseibacillus pabuli]|uniref:Helix-turn-helix domain-containing protein n=1 Tax=Lacticaseibacillus pabuli TaxID=3025672 RepID=A0ABY7WR39_9LACO|nr:AraC family transcriptional regulator [Lacticaseibacillus sp. KACC 23028]WDF82650.1 helix-turn-helix domain-containing protein [Lacticaseibacillus sp. KACC 23028]
MTFEIHQRPVAYDFGSYPLAIHVLELYKHGYQVPRHWHNELEFLTPISGEVQVTVGTEAICLTRNHGVLINAGRVHSLTAEPGSDGRLLAIQLNPDLLLNGAEPQLALRLSDVADDFLLLDSQKSWQDAVLKQLSRLGNYYRFGGADPLTVYMEALAVTARCLQHVQLSGAGSGSNRLQFIQMRSYIEENYSKELSVSTIARRGGVGRSSCFALFATFASQTPSEYVQSCRMRHAQTLLAASDLEVAEIGTRCGYKTASYFSMQFKKQNGCTPRDYRQSVRTISD